MDSSKPNAHALLVMFKQECAGKEKERGQKTMELLYVRYAPQFYRYALKRGLPPHQADDIVQDTFEHIMQRIICYDEMKGGGDRWMWTICNHQIIDTYRTLPLECIPENLPNADLPLEEHAEQQERLQSFVRAWTKLSASDQEALKRGRGRGPGRNAWHEAVHCLRALLSCDE